MNILYLGDIMGEPGIRVVENLLPKIRKQHSVDLVIAQSENVSQGKGILPSDYKRLQTAGVDFFSGGNWSLYHKETEVLLDNPKEPIIRPLNYPLGTKGLGYKYIDTKFGKVLVVSLLGKIVGRDADLLVDNPLKIIDQLLIQEKDSAKIATVVNFHGDYSSEKVVIGYYLDGRVSAVIGDHWHVPTADAMILPKGTAHITDVGMCGILHSSLGIRTDVIIDRWLDSKIIKNQLENDGDTQLNSLLFSVDIKTGLATSLEPIRVIKTN
ncbi:MAG TPA: TIGR00282 family metallophosphoesterase [Candidatus Saccharimonadia bacterium]|nr:TIGR00282 family metallophosphoesterase [Candidatus Saccharimonadia bacterium]